MRFKIKEIGEEGLPLAVPVTADFIAEECPGLDATPGPKGIFLRGQLLRSGDDVFLRGRLQGAYVTTCARCLEPARVPLDVALDVTFATRAEGDPEPDSEEEDVDVAYLDGEEVDLAPEIRDHLLLTFPIKPLCREDCAGLCAICGGNRNHVPCSCVAREDDALKDNLLATALGKLKI